jgi:hypothetical protein
MRGNHLTRSDAASAGVVWLTILSSVGVFLLNSGLRERRKSY